MQYQVAVEYQRHAGGSAHRGLERGISAGIPSGIEIGIAIQVPVVGVPIVQQVGNAEVQSAASGENLVADAAVSGMGVGSSAHVPLGEVDAHLHGAARAHRVGATQQALAQRHFADEVLVQFTEFALGTHRIQSLGVGKA